MSILDSQFRTVTCNAPSCKNTVTFQQAQDQIAVKEAMEANAWLKTTRLVQQIYGGRNFCYCSDACELEGVAANYHNPDEPKKIIATPAGAGQIAQAAEAAKRAEEATKALKAGGPVTVHGA